VPQLPPRHAHMQPSLEILRTRASGALRARNPPTRSMVPSDKQPCSIGTENLSYLHAQLLWDGRIRQVVLALEHLVRVAFGWFR
jgi:hypothetical protein